MSVEKSRDSARAQIRKNPTMEDAQWKEFVSALVDAKRSLSEAWSILDGTDGAAPETQAALTAALAGIDALYGIEASHDANLDVASPPEVQQFWDDNQQLPGFAVGS